MGAPPASRPAYELDGPNSEPTLRPGTVLNGTYEIRGILGQGGMGRVYEAYDHLLARAVAIKVAWAHVGAPPLRKEAQALAAIRHPAMIDVHAIGSHEGVEYLVMERIHGMSLEAHIDAKVAAGESFSLTEALDILIKIADGLAAVHRAGIAHRDVKPGNIMLAPDDRTVLMDFGLFVPEFDIARQTRAAGSPQYMAPEAIVNDIEAGAGHLLDLYALGAVAFEILAGEAPFEGDTVPQVLGKVLRSPVPDLRALRPDVPPDLAALVTSLLAKSPRDRPQTIEPVLWQLREIRSRVREDDATLHAFSVLVVDDDPQFLTLVRALVRRAMPAADVHTARNAEQAIESARRASPRLMLVDLHMPGMNGIELCMYLRGTTFVDRTRFVAVSAHADARDVGVLRQLGVTDFISKGPGLASDLGALLDRARPRSMAPRPHE